MGLAKFGWRHRLVGATGFLILVGLTLQFSLSPALFYTHLVFVGLGLATMWVFSKIELSWYRYFAGQIYLGLVGLLGLTLLVGVRIRGSSRWVDLGLVRFQPSELVKPFLVAILAYWLIDGKGWTDWIKTLVLMGIPLAMVLFQPDLGTTLVLSATIIVMLLVYGPTRKLAVVFLTIGLVVSPLLIGQLAPYQRDRLLSFTDPYADPLGSGYNVLQAQLAIGSGKLWGKGLGTGSQSKLNFLPEKQTDFAFASLAEEVGFVGSFILVAVMFFWLGCMWFIVRETRTEYYRLLIIGLMILLMTQTFINLGMNLGLLPVTGLTLPWISAGGSSIISVGVILGMILSTNQGGSE